MATSLTSESASKHRNMGINKSPKENKKNRQSKHTRTTFTILRPNEKFKRNDLIDCNEGNKTNQRYIDGKSIHSPAKRERKVFEKFCAAFVREEYAFPIRKLGLKVTDTRRNCLIN